MTEAEFHDWFATRVAAMPEQIGTHVTSFIDSNGIKLRLLIGDEHVEKVEKREGKKYPAAITMINDNEREYWMVFRPKLLNAPDDILQTVVWHEVAHIFVNPVLYPPKRFKKLPDPHFVSVVTYRKEMAADPVIAAKGKLPKADYEETLVEFIVRSLGCDEIAVRDWLAKN